MRPMPIQPMLYWYARHSFPFLPVRPGLVLPMPACKLCKRLHDILTIARPCQLPQGRRRQETGESQDEAEGDPEGRGGGGGGAPVDRVARPQSATPAPDHAGGGDETVQRASRALNYRPNAAATSLRTNRTSSIGVVVPDITNPVFPPIIRGIEDAPRRPRLPRHPRQHRRPHGPRGGGRRHAARPRRRRSDPGQRRARGRGGLAARRGGPADRHRQPPPRRSGGLLGHQRRGGRHPPVSSSTSPASATGRSPTSPGRNRCRPASRATAPSRTIAAARPRPRPGTGRLRRRLQRSGRRGGRSRCCFAAASRSPPSSAPTTAWRSAPSTRSAGAGRDCPSDVSVTGYNDMPLVDRLSPPLTTVRIQQYNVGLNAAHVLIEAIETPPERRPRGTSSGRSTWSSAARRAHHESTRNQVSACARHSLPRFHTGSALLISVLSRAKVAVAGGWVQDY